MQGSTFLQNWNRWATEDRVAVEDRTGVTTYRELTARAQLISERLLKDQFKEKSSLQSARVGIFVEPGAHFVTSFLGVLSSGGVAVVLSPLHPNVESSYFCNDAQVQTVITSKAWRSRAEEFAPNRLILEVESFNAVSARQNEQKCPLQLGEQIVDDAPALQLYTSGTTGKPKGAVLSHSNLGTQQILLQEAWGLSSSDILLHTLPLHHMHGLCIALWSVLGAGGRVHFKHPFEPGEIWNEMGRTSVFMAVPTLYSKLFAHFDSQNVILLEQWKRNAQNLRLATSGSAALPVTLANRWKDLTSLSPLERFGMTEVGVGLSNPLNGNRKPGFVGVPLPGVKFRIVDEAGRDAPQGELWIAGPSVFLGYFNRNESTEQTFVNIEGVRYFKTGDTVTRDDEGYFKILGRNSVDILKSGGYKLSAIEIEEVFREHPAVSEVAVVGVPDEVWGDRVTACVVLKKGLELGVTEESLRTYAKQKLASYKVPKQIVFLSQFPVNALGKVIKKELIKLLPNQTEQSKTSTGNSPNRK